MYKNYRHSRYTNYYKRPFYKRKGIYIGLILLVGVIVFVSWSIKKAPQDPAVVQQITDQPQAPVIDGKITLLTGMAQVKTAAADWTNVADGAALHAGDSLKTAAGGRVIVALPDKSEVRLLENSEIQFTKLGMTDITIEQVSGTTYHRVNDQSTAIYRVTKGNIELTALGTAFSVTNEDKVLKVTVIESHLKAKIYDGQDVVNLRTVDAGTRATINPGLAIAQMIQSDDVTAGTLIANEWYSWNLGQDKAKNLALGIFEKLTALTITEPTTATVETDQDKLTIKGTTDKGAKILVANKDVKNNGGQFETSVDLVAGANTIDVIVKKDNNINQRTIIVNSNQKAKSIALTGVRLDQTSVKLSWETANLIDFKEFRVLLGKDVNPTYPTATNHVIDNKTAVAVWDDLADGKYSFRICALSSTDNSCLVYSNNIELLVGDAALWDDLEIKLSASLIDDKNASLSWTTNKTIDSSVSLKTILTTTKAPSYPGKANHAITAGRSADIWENLDAGTSHFHVCLFTNNQCLKYSNDATVTIAVATVPKISLAGTAGAGKVTLTWTNNNVPATTGFKSLMSETPNVTFPGTDSHLLTSATDVTDTWANLTVGKTYYFRVCQNMGSSCGVYSNEIALTVK